MAPTDPITVMGVDGTQDGWVAVKAQNGRFASIHHYPNVDALAADNPDASTIAIDIPLWFPSGKEPRTSDPAARALLGPRRSSVFAVPHREVLEASSYEAANQLSKNLFGRGITQQSYALGAKILEAVGFVESSGENRLREVHPELSFHFLAKELGQQVTASKKTWAGFAERLSLLQSVGLSPPFEARLDLGRAGVDDVLDACVGAWSAQRIACGKAKLVGADPGLVSRDARTGHPEAIYA